VSESQILAPPAAACAWLQVEGITDIALLAPEATAADFAGMTLLPADAEQGAGAVVLGDLAQRWDFQTLNRAFWLLVAKPAPAFSDAAIAAVGSAPDQTLMIGDDIRGDVAGAQRTGLKTALVRTGKLRPTDLHCDIRPDAVLSSVGDLPTWWQKPGH
jgi:hypothetical protein